MNSNEPPDCLLQAGEVSLHAAVQCGHVGVVKALLNKGASVDTKTKVGCFPYNVLDYHASLLVGEHWIEEGNGANSRTRITTISSGCSPLANNY